MPYSIAAPHKLAKTRMNFQEAIAKFVNHLDSLDRSPSTITAYKKDISQLQEYTNNHLNLEDVTRVTAKNLKEYVKTLKTDNKYNYTLKTVSRKLNSMKTFFKFLKSEGITDKDPAEKVEHHKYEVQPPRILSKLEYRALRDAARSNIRLFAIVEILLQTGIRIGELARLKLDDVKLDDSKGKITIRGYASNDKREVSLNEQAQNAIKKYLKIRPQPNEKVNALFVTKNGNPLLVRNIRTSITRAFEKAGIEDAKVNDIRNTFIMHQLRNGMSCEDVAEIVGHKRITSTQKYMNLMEEDPKRRTNKIISL